MIVLSVGVSVTELAATIDNRGGRRDWKCLYVYTKDARHGHVTLPVHVFSYCVLTTMATGLVRAALCSFLTDSSAIEVGE